MLKIKNTPSPNFDERKASIDSVILHYTDLPSAEEALSWLTSPRSRVSAHYLIDEEGAIFQLVPDEKRAWHAGESFWQGCTDLNSCSLGIELVNPGHTHGYQPFPEAQVEILLVLCERLCREWDIPKDRILGHSDIAPRRKQDPGHLFPWGTLAHEGFGLWPIDDATAPKGLRTDDFVKQSLSTIGYETLSLPHTITAFKKHFQPHQRDNKADFETLSLLQGLLDSQKMLI